MSRGLAQFVAGMGAGYLKADRQRIEDERQAKLDKMREDESAMRKTQFDQQNEIYQAGRTKRENDAALDKAVTEEMSAGTATPGFGSQSSSGKFFSKNQSDAQAVADINTAADEMAAGPADQSAAPVSTPQPVAPAVAVGESGGRNRLFTGLNSAAQAKQFADENPTTSYARYSALSDRLATMAGGQDKADAYLERAKKADKEGVFRALVMAQDGNFAGAKKAYNSTGIGRLPDSQDLRFGADGKTVEVFDKESGKVVTPDVNQKLIGYLNGAEGVIAQNQATAKIKNDMSLKQWEYQNDPSKRFIANKPGGELFDTVTGKNVSTSTMGYKPVLDANGVQRRDADGDLMFDKSGAKGGSDATDSRKVISETLDFIGKNSTLKDSPPEVTARAQQYAYQIVANSAGTKSPVPPELAVTIAVEASLKPDLLKIRLNPSTGSINQVFDSPATGEVTFQRDYASAMKPNGVLPEQLKGFANQVVQSQPPAVKEQMVSAAFDGTGVARKTLETNIKGAINADFDRQLKANPGQRGAIEATRAATITSSMESLGRKLDLVANHYPKPKPIAAKGSSLTERLEKTVGMGSPAGGQGSNKYAGMTRSQMDAADAKEARDWREKNPRPKADPRIAAQLAELEQQRANLLRQNKAVDANAVTQKMRSLSSQQGL